MPAGDHRREAGWAQGACGNRRRVSRVEGVLAGAAARSEIAWLAGWSAAVRRRWRNGFLGRTGGSVSCNARPALLVSQDGQRAQRAAEVATGAREGRPAGNLDGRDTCRRLYRVRSVRSDLCSEI